MVLIYIVNNKIFLCVINWLKMMVSNKQLESVTSDLITHQLVVQERKLSNCLISYALLTLLLLILLSYKLQAEILIPF